MLYLHPFFSVAVIIACHRLKRRWIPETQRPVFMEFTGSIPSFDDETSVVYHL